MSAYYNEFDPFAAAWLRELIHEGLIADGEVDERSIADVAAADLAGFTQHHFFAGIGGWSYALRLAGWPDDRPVWTGSCPCQPFSAAGKRKGTADERHLWPEFLRLIRQCRPSVVFGEQVASKDGRAWLAGVRTDLERLAYDVGAADLCAAGVGSPNIRQRLYWVADAERDAGKSRWLADESREGVGAAGAGPCAEPGRRGVSGERLADADGGLSGHRGLQPGGQHGQQQEDGRTGERVGDTDEGGRVGPHAHIRQRGPFEAGVVSAGSGTDGGLGVAAGIGRPRFGAQPEHGVPGQAGETPWSRSVFIPCSDGKQRRVPANETGQPEPALFPLAYGIPNRVGTLRGAGNAINPWLAAEFIQAYLDARNAVLTVGK